MGLRELAIVFLRERQAFRARHVPVVDHAARVARRAAKTEFDELHVVIDVVDLVVEAVEIREGSIRAALRRRQEIDLVLR